MIEVLVIIALVALLAWERYNDRKERAKLINMIYAKRFEEVRDLEMADKTEIKVKPTNEMPDLIPTDQLNDEDWEKAEIKKEKIKWPIN